MGLARTGLAFRRTQSLKSKTLFIKTFGCQMNVYDSERMGEALGRAGYAQAEREQDADLIVLNTCHIREKAAEKVYSDLGRIRMSKEERRLEGKNTVVAVAGCVAQAEGELMIERAPVVDVVVGPQSYHRLPELLARIGAGERGLVETDFSENEKFERLGDERRARLAPTAFLTVQEGCDKFCTFCVVPYTRGAEFSRPAADLVAEAERLAGGGVRELTLLGQNVNAYHGKGPDGRIWTLADLIVRLAKVEGLGRLRYTTSHPRDMGDDLIALHRDEPKLMPYLHLPFQSGSDRVLAAMHRRHTVADYEQLVARLRDARTDLALSTDVIVGFPGETDIDFEHTLGLVRRIGFAQAFSFKYSPRPGTPAAALEAQVPETIKAERLAALQALIAAQQQAFSRATVGSTLPVLFERAGRKSGQAIGRTPYLQSVHAEAASELMGEIVPVSILAAGPNSLNGVIKAKDDWSDLSRAAS